MAQTNVDTGLIPANFNFQTMDEQRLVGWEGSNV